MHLQNVRGLLKKKTGALLPFRADIVAFGDARRHHQGGVSTTIQALYDHAETILL